MGDQWSNGDPKSTAEMKRAILAAAEKAKSQPMRKTKKGMLSPDKLLAYQSELKKMKNKHHRLGCKIVKLEKSIEKGMIDPSPKRDSEQYILCPHCGQRATTDGYPGFLYSYAHSTCPNDHEWWYEGHRDGDKLAYVGEGYNDKEGIPDAFEYRNHSFNKYYKPKPPAPPAPEPKKEEPKEPAERTRFSYLEVD